jgi:large subunit ribosomal protein L10
MPNIVNEMLFDELQAGFREAGSCLVVSFDGLTVAQASELRNRFRAAGLDYRVVKNRLATRAAREVTRLDLSAAFRGKCGVIFAPTEGAIAAAKLIREVMKKEKQPQMVVTGAVIEGEAITGTAAATVADMPDRATVNTQIVTAISGPARSLAMVVQALAAGVARCMQAKIDKAAG